MKLILFLILIGSFYFSQDSLSNDQINSSILVQTLKKQLNDKPNDLSIRKKLATVLSKYPNSHDEIIQTLNPYTHDLDTETLLILAGAFHNKKSFSDEVRVLKRVVELTPKNEKSHFILANAYLNNNSIESAIHSFRECLKLNPKYRAAYDSLLDIFQKNSNNYESRVILSDMKKIFKQDTKIYNHLCRLDSNDGYLDSAIKNCNQAIKMNPKTPENYVYLSQSLSDKGESSLAGKNLINASKKFKNSEFVQWATGQYYFKQKNFGVAKQYFQLASKIDSKSFRSHLNLGECYFELNEWENSYNSLKSACTLNESAIDKIREYSGRLRISKESEWSKKFSKLMYECKKNL